MIGAVYLENRSKTGQFTRDDLPLLILFANQAAVAIENALLNDSLEAEVAARTAELQKAMAELEQRWLAAVEFNRIRSLLSTTLAHDIRAPLSLVIMTLDQLRYGIFGKLLPEQETVVLSAYQSAHHALKLSSDFFDLVKLELKKLTLYPQRMDTSGYLQMIYKIGQAMPWAEGVKFELALEPDLPQLDFDPTRIQQVIINLLSNALKFTQQGSVTLYAYKAQGGNTLIIGVRDTGPGLAASESEMIFERFQQAGDQNMRQRGTGLGLAICKELIELHRGRIWVESQLDVGSDFKFSLPLPAKSG
jgi:signal transduction histidine kinase